MTSIIRHKVDQESPSQADSGGFSSGDVGNLKLKSSKSILTKRDDSLTKTCKPPTDDSPDSNAN